MYQPNWLRNSWTDMVRGRRVVRRLVSGAEGARTPGLRHAMTALSQLSYGPRAPNCSLEREIDSPVDPSALPISGRRQPQLDCVPPPEAFNGYVVAAVDLGAIGRDRIDLVWRIRTPDVSAGPPAARTARNDNDVAAFRRRLALDAYQPGP